MFYPSQSTIEHKEKLNLEGKNGCSATWTMRIVFQPWFQASVMELMCTRKMDQCLSNSE